MLNRFPLLVVLAGLVVGFTPSVQAQYGPRSITSVDLDRLGLVKEWSGRLPIDPLRTRFKHFSQIISSKDPLVIYELEHAGRQYTFSADQLGPVGLPLGDEGAKALAEQQIARLDTRLGEPKLSRREVPSITFVAQSDAGALMAIDGRTGRFKWNKIIGSRELPGSTPAGNDDYVVAVSGFELFCLRRDTGELLWTKPIEGVPVAGPALNERWIYVPLAGGKVIARDFDGGPRLIPEYSSIGRLTNPIVATSTSLAWSTTKDYFYVAFANKPENRYRIEATGEILAPPVTYGQSRLFFSTSTGYIYCIYMIDGSIRWRFSCGNPIDQAAVPIKDAVYVTLQRGGLYKLGVNDGEPQWFVPRIRQFLAANDQYLYALEDGRRMVVLDINTGARLGSIDVGNYDFFHTNAKTDRIILGTTTGKLLVLRSQDRPYPLVHVDVTAPDAPSTPDGQAPAQPGANPFAEPQPGNQPAPAAADPFAAPAGDPFAAPATNTPDPFAAPATSTPDPFAAPGSTPDPFGAPATDDSNPFGPPAASDDGAMEDPFGNADPFGS